MIFIKNNRSQFQNNVSWKSNSNSIIVPKNIKNEISTSDQNDIEKIVWPKTCEFKSKYKFKPNPIKHYRKQYTTAKSFSNSSMVGFLDKPGNYIVTDSSNCKTCGNLESQNISIHLLQNIDKHPQPGDWKYDSKQNKMICTGCNPQSLVIKPATTVIDKTYSSSNREYLYRKCRTFHQNAIKLKSNLNCTEPFQCNPVIQHTNKKYGTTGPVTSSSRITALKYGCNNQDKIKCYIRKTDYNDENFCGTGTLEECKKKYVQNPGCIGCKEETNKTIRRKRINILN